jgi:hypothetical protein
MIFHTMESPDVIILGQCQFDYTYQMITIIINVSKILNPRRSIINKITIRYLTTFTLVIVQDTRYNTTVFKTEESHKEWFDNF